MVKLPLVQLSQAKIWTGQILVLPADYFIDRRIKGRGWMMFKMPSGNLVRDVSCCCAR